MTLHLEKNGSAHADPPAVKTNGVHCAAPNPDEERPGLRVIQISPGHHHTPPGNRIPTMESCTDLLASISDIGQKVPGIVCPHPDQPEDWYRIAGNRRGFVCDLLGIPFMAVPLPKACSKAETIKLRLTENVLRDAMSWLEIADDIMEYMKLEGLTQAAACERLHLNPATGSKALTIAKNLAPSLRPMLENFTLCPSVAYLIASEPDHEKQLGIAQRATPGGFKRELVERLVREGKGKKSPKMKPLKLKVGSVAVTVTGNTVEALQAFTAKITEALKKLQRDNLPPDCLGALLK